MIEYTEHPNHGLPYTRMTITADSIAAGIAEVMPFIRPRSRKFYAHDLAEDYAAGLRSMAVDHHAGNGLHIKLMVRGDGCGAGAI